MSQLKILFLADTHLGLDSPLRPRVERRRRGPDFFVAFERALQPALDGQVDCVIHGGDLLYRSRVGADLVLKAFEPLHRVAEAGVPVYLVPGNHERSVIPFPLLAANPRIHIFRGPQTFLLEKAGIRLGLAGFPFTREDLSLRWPDLVEATGWRSQEVDAWLLCVHQAFEGAQVGPSNYTFRPGKEVVRGRAIPPGFLAVLSGHIHRAQILRADLEGAALAAPVIYPGSTERTSFAEKDEEKGYFILTIEGGGRGPHLSASRFERLPVRPMREIRVPPGSPEQQLRAIETALAVLPPDSVVQVRLTLEEGQAPPLSEARLRAMAPSSMNLSLSLPGGSRSRKDD